LGALQQELTTLTERLAARESALAEQEHLQARESNLKTLEKLFKGRGFVDYVSRVYLEQLTAAANTRFQELTGRQLALHLGDDNGFQIRDYMNGGEQRSVKTLSGGQMFQASFSLALALADSVQQLARAKQRFFFLDEGFGTLDNTALRSVLSALKALRSEQRIVGVISHVEALQQEMSVFLSVENTAERGSVITPSWEQD
jgi:exonuclease SbcC